MTDKLGPAIGEIVDISSPESYPYVFGHVALNAGGEADMVGALGKLHDSHMSGGLRPPIPSALAARASETVQQVRSGGQVDGDMVRGLLASILNFGVARYSTDLSWNERREQLRRRAIA